MKLLSLLNIEFSEVEKAADGLPVAWPVFHEGNNELTIQGKGANLQLSAQDLDDIAAYQAKKGCKIPIDSRHVISSLALKIGRDESDILKEMPGLAGTAGFANLTHKNKSLMLSEVEWNELGGEIMKSGLIRYFSPTVQGLDGKSPLRVTSVSLDNEPCLNGISSLACSEANVNQVATPEDLLAVLTKKGEKDMPDKKEPEKKVDPPKEKDSKKPVTPPTPPQKDMDILKAIHDVLGADVTAETLKPTLAALKANSDSLPELQEKVKNLELSESKRVKMDEANKLQMIQNQGLKESKLTKADLDTPFFKGLNSLQLSAYLETRVAGSAVPVDNLQLSEKSKGKKPAHFSSISEAIAAAPTTIMC